MEAIFGVFLGFLLVFGHHLAEGCTCGRLHPQQYFCFSTFAIKATILSRKVNGSIYEGDLLYQARIHEIFKMENDNIKEGATVTIKTDPSGTMCGETGLQNDKTYVLTGDVSDKLLRIGCGFNMPWDQVTTFQRKAFRYFYKLSCTEEVEEGYVSRQCQVRTDYGYRSTSLQPSQQCYWTWNNDCATKYSTCMYQTKGSCEWLRTSAYKDCMGKEEEDSGSGSGSGSGYLPSWL